MVDESSLREVREQLRAANRVVVLTGAGISAESGVPTFRDAQTGLWAKFDPQQLATEEAFRANHGLQCGYCTPGLVRAATGLRAETPTPSEEQIRPALEGNLCRCTGYHNIVRSIEAAAAATV